MSLIQIENKEDIFREIILNLLPIDFIIKKTPNSYRIIRIATNSLIIETTSLENLMIYSYLIKQGAVFTKHKK